MYQYIIPLCALKNTPLYGITTVCFSTHRWWTFELFPPIGFVNSTAVNIHVHKFVWIRLSGLGQSLPRSGTAGSV